MDGIDVEIISDNTLTTYQSKEVEVRNWQEELATAILGRLKDTETLKFRFLDSTLTPKEKLEAIIQFKTAMMTPSLRMAMGLEYDPAQLKGAYSVMELLSSVESSIKELINYEDNEVIDFNHPKIVASYKMLFEIVVAILQEEVKDQIVINNIIEKVAVRCVGFEQEMNKAFRKVSNKIAEMTVNPVLDIFNNRNKDKRTRALHLLDTIERCRDIIDDETYNAILNNIQQSTKG